MESEPQTALEEAHTQAQPPKAISPARLWLERISIGIVAVVSILIPLVFGLLFYLAVTDGLVINGGDPLHEVRLWMVQERKGATGLGLTIASPSGSGRDNVVCAHTSVTFLRWDRSLSLASEAGYCRCYDMVNGQLADANNATCR